MVAALGQAVARAGDILAGEMVVAAAGLVVGAVEAAGSAGVVVRGRCCMTAFIWRRMN